MTKKSFYTVLSNECLNWSADAARLAEEHEEGGETARAAFWRQRADKWQLRAAEFAEKGEFVGVAA